MKHFCCDERRRNLIKSQTQINGIDFLEVSDDPALPLGNRQRLLFVIFLHGLAPGVLTKENIKIEGGERIRNIRVIRVTSGTDYGSPPASPPLSSLPDDPARLLVVEVDQPGDFSTYTLRLVRSPQEMEPPPGFDPILSAVDFSFKVACPSDFDCLKDAVCSFDAVPRPDINYLAKDYASFRQLMLDRMAVVMPQWRERNAADLGIVLVELLAYVADSLSYQQDAVATEAYLGTARRRVSVRRHTRLVDYAMHDGCNARAWVHVRLRPDVDHLLLKKELNGSVTKVLTRIEGRGPLMALDSDAYKKALAARSEVFELMDDITLYADHNKMRFYTWGARECCLPKEAIKATLRGHYPNLKKGDVLIFIEERSPQTGRPEDADTTRRHAVRLTDVILSSDPLGDQTFGSPPAGSPPQTEPLSVTEIQWHSKDALPFAFCISARRGAAYYDDVSIALGNVVLADHGLTFADKADEDAKDPESVPSSLKPDTVPRANPALVKVSTAGAVHCQEPAAEATPPRFRPRLKQKPLTCAAPYDVDQPPASAKGAMTWSMKQPLAAISLREFSESPEIWIARRDLLGSGPDEKEFVVEVESDGTAYLRFGDDRFGSRPAADTKFLATYRTGNGVSGNVGAETLAHLVSADPLLTTETDNPMILEVRNPLPAQGGVEPESIEQARQIAPRALQTQERAVTPADYATMAQRCDPSIQRAAATLRWTGSWRTVFLTVDRLGGQEVDKPFRLNLRQCLERFRMAGHDLEVDGPRYVSLEIEMKVCINPGYLAGDIKQALLEIFSKSILPDGRRGVFHPDNFTFGQTVYLSPLYAAAQEMAGVDSVEITKFQRQGDSDTTALDSGKLELGHLEIARLDNDPSFPERGVFNLILKGGR